MALTYTYEVRQGSDVVSTGRLTSDHPLDVDDRLAVAGALTTVIEVPAHVQPRLARSKVVHGLLSAQARVCLAWMLAIALLPTSYYHGTRSGPILLGRSDGGPT